MWEALRVLARGYLQVMVECGGCQVKECVGSADRGCVIFVDVVRLLCQVAVMRSRGQQHCHKEG